MTEKPNIAMYWAAGCGGCEVSLANIHESLLDVDANFNLVFCPCLMDTKKKDVEAMPDGHIFITFFNGAIRTEENEEMAHLLRKKSKILIAYGACAKDGGIPALSNWHTSKDHFESVYFKNQSIDNPFSITPKTVTEVPEGTLTIPAFYKQVKSLDRVIDVDFYMPGCPPEPAQLINVVHAVLSGAVLPPKGGILGAGTSTVCSECSRTKSEKKITKFYRTYEIITDPTECLLEQGIVCMGVATRNGCGGLCPTANMPCIGCYGAPEGVQDQGAKMISALGSIMDISNQIGTSEDTINSQVSNMLDEIPDLAGSFYKFTSANVLRTKE